MPKFDMHIDLRGTYPVEVEAETIEEARELLSLVLVQAQVAVPKGVKPTSEPRADVVFMDLRQYRQAPNENAAR